MKAKRLVRIADIMVSYTYPEPGEDRLDVLRTRLTEANVTEDEFRHVMRRLPRLMRLAKAVMDREKQRKRKLESKPSLN